jgi:6-phosphogluconate dehydrogenase
MEEEKEQETEELGEAPKEEIRVWGLGVMLKKMDKLLAQNETIISILRYSENKLEALLDEDAKKRLDAIKRRF